MAQTNETQTNPPADELEAMQERALQHDIDVADPTGRDLTLEELRPLVENAEANMSQLSPEERQYELAKLNEKRVNAQAMAEAQGGQRSVSDPITPPSISSNAPGTRKLREPIKLDPQPVSGDLARAVGLDKAEPADIDLAKLHNYPVAIPGAKAYVTDIEMRCALGGGVRPAGSVILLIDKHARNKLEYLTPVEDVPEAHVVPVAARNAPVQPSSTQSPAAARQAAGKPKAHQGSKTKANK